MSNYNRISFKERVRIEAGIYAKKSFSQIAKKIGRSTSSVRTKEQVLLTIMFNSNSVMLMILIEEEAMDPVIEVFDKLTKALGVKRFRKLFPVILTDNGRCFKNALALEYTKSGSPRTKIFYCDPQASWQKPHIEKNHEFIRYVIPRGKTFKGYTQEDMTLIANISTVQRDQDLNTKVHTIL